MLFYLNKKNCLEINLRDNFCSKAYCKSIKNDWYTLFNISEFKHCINAGCISIINLIIQTCRYVPQQNFEIKILQSLNRMVLMRYFETDITVENYVINSELFDYVNLSGSCCIYLEFLFHVICVHHVVVNIYSIASKLTH